MKIHPLLAGLIFASSLFGVQCTEEQYKPFFSDTTRYLYVIESNNHSMSVIDTKNIIYDAKKQTIECWVVFQVKDPQISAGTVSTRVIFDIKNQKHAFLSELTNSCDGKVLSDKKEEMVKCQYIAPGSIGETILNKLKVYLKLK